ncbi:hypothetical protein GCM10017044_14280 [Kordiimonas sediminis]|uniref:DAGKc domain-containing protein n=1 Tax=Kordiimonas sediminis TaxID=1735581 RepID=A0A919ARH5_9PROT|nr:diacylglycerol kinase family protein [Kordiimonas sediminis]GHF20546.1 hypothetical protein GCM10017044_14280 [Kordiimonas sediminis]
MTSDTAHSKQDRAFTLIRNPVAGWSKDKFTLQVADHLRSSGANVHTELTERPGHATDIAREIATQNPDRIIIAAGGDGTIREVAEGVFETISTMGIIPAGNANVLAREIGYGTGGLSNPQSVARHLLSMTPLQLFPFQVTLQNQTRLAMCWAGIGFDAEILARVNPAHKKRFGRAAFVPATASALLQEKHHPVIPTTLQLPQAYWLLAANIRSYAGPFKISTTSACAAPGLHVHSFEGYGSLARLWDMVSISFHKTGNKTTCFVEKESFTAGDETTPIQIDGDFVGYGPVTVTPLQTSINILGTMP